MYYSKAFALTYLLFLSSIIGAQETGKGKAIIFFGSNTPTIVRLDTALIQQSQKPFLLNEGKYVIKAWAPTKKLFIDTITIQEGKTTICVRKLENSDDYDLYKRNLNMYKLKIMGTRFVPFPLTAGYALFSYLRYNKNKKLGHEHLLKAQEAKRGYETSISVSNITKNYELYYEEKAQYENYIKKNNKLSVATSIIIPTGIVASAAIMYLSKKIKRPAFSETKLLSLNSAGIEYESSSCSLSLIFDIQIIKK